MTIIRHPFPTLTDDQRAEAVARILDNIEPQADGCWLWTRTLTTKGYARLKIAGQSVMAHRALYELCVGPVPVELDLDHLCRVPRCLNPAHLEPVTRRTNILRGDTLTGHNAAVTQCPYGHPYDEANTYHRKCGSRTCRACDRAHHRRRYTPIAERELVLECAPPAAPKSPARTGPQ